jgi:hypothetical protein
MLQTCQRWVPDTAAQHEAMVVNLQSCHHFIDNVPIDTLAAYEAAKMRTGVKTELEHWETSGKIYPGGVSIEPPGRILTDRRIVWMSEPLNQYPKV